MTQEQFSNNYQTNLNGSITSGQTSIVVKTNPGFPSVAQFRIIIDSEVMTVTAGSSGLTWTVTRNSEAIFNGSGPAAHADNALVTTILTTGAIANAIALPVTGASWAANTLLTLNSIANNYGLKIVGPAGAGTSFGIFSSAGTNSSDYSARFQTQALVDILKLRGDGQLIANGPLTVPPSISGAIPPTSYGTLSVKLDEQTSTSTSLTLTVPAGALYRVLEIDLTGRSSGAASSVAIQFNADVAANYDNGGFSVANTTVTGTTPTIAGTSGVVATIPVSTATAGEVSNFRIIIQNADSTTLRKPYESYGARFDSDAAAGFNFNSYVGHWRNTSNAITSITLLVLGGPSFANTKAILYGRP